MIYDRIQNASYILELISVIDTALEFLLNNDLSQAEPGRPMSWMATNIYYIVQEYQSKTT